MTDHLEPPSGKPEEFISKQAAERIIDTLRDRFLSDQIWQRFKEQKAEQVTSIILEVFAPHFEAEKDVLRATLQILAEYPNDPVLVIQSQAIRKALGEE